LLDAGWKQGKNGTLIPPPDEEIKEDTKAPLD